MASLNVVSVNAFLILNSPGGYMYMYIDHEVYEIKNHETFHIYNMYMYMYVTTCTCTHVCPLFSLSLGKLTRAQIKSGYTALKKVEGLIQSGTTSGDPLFRACDEFYTRVPHDFG